MFTKMLVLLILETWNPLHFLQFAALCSSKSAFSFCLQLLFSAGERHENAICSRKKPCFLSCSGGLSRKHCRHKRIHQSCFQRCKTECLNRSKKRFGVYQKRLFSREKQENTCTPKSLAGVCGGAHHAALVYTIGPKMITHTFLWFGN